MPSKQFTLDERSSQPVLITIYKRRASRSLRLSIAHNGEVRVSIPLAAPYMMGINFAKARIAWIREHQQPTTILQTGQPIGKANHLLLIASPDTTRVATRIRNGQVVVTYPTNLAEGDPAVQKAAERAAIRALRAQATLLLPQRLHKLAAEYGFEYKNVTIKQLQGRWGSCDHQQNIVLNLFLMELPWECIDYVLLHELTHTIILKHGPEFWQAMERVLPDVKQVRKIMRSQQPIIQSHAA